MSGIAIDNSPKVKTVTDIDFVFASGTLLPIVIDHEAGDKITEESDRFVVEISGKSSLLDPEVSLGTETITIYKNHLLFNQSRKRDIRGLSPEEALELKEHNEKLTGSVN